MNFIPLQTSFRIMCPLGLARRLAIIIMLLLLLLLLLIAIIIISIIISRNYHHHHEESTYRLRHQHPRIVAATDDSTT